MQYVINVLTFFGCAAILTVNVGQFETTSIEGGVDSVTASGDDKYNNILDTIEKAQPEFNNHNFPHVAECSQSGDIVSTTVNTVIRNMMLTSTMILHVTQAIPRAAY